MFENEYLTHEFFDVLPVVDGVITPCRFCQKIFQDVTKKPVWICPLGVNLDEFRFKPRSWSPKRGERFRWLFIGAPNYRKHSILEELHEVLFSRLPNEVELYIKTTGASMDGTGEDVIQRANWTVDNRSLPTDQIVKLHHASHGALSLHTGEGWGNFSMECFASGLPLVVTDYSATQDFCNQENSFPVKTQTASLGMFTDLTLRERVIVRTQVPDLMDTLRAVRDVMTDYPAALRKAQRARQTAVGHSWDASAKRLLDILDSPCLQN